jgi:hypothetical protein
VRHAGQLDRAAQVGQSLSRAASFR